MSKKYIPIIIIVIVLLAIGIYWFYSHKEPEIVPELEEGKVESEEKSFEGVGNPLEEMPSANPYEDVNNPYEDSYKNPFE